MLAMNPVFDMNVDKSIFTFMYQGSYGHQRITWRCGGGRIQRLMRLGIYNLVQEWVTGVCVDDRKGEEWVNDGLVNEELH